MFIRRPGSFKNLFILLFVLLFLMNGGLTASASDWPLPAPDKINYAPLDFKLPKMERITLNNGIVLYLLENHDLPLININALIKTGTIYDPEGKEGTGELTAYLMRTGGTAKFNSTEIDNLLDFMGASASITMSRESAQFHFSVLSNDIERGLELLAEMLIHPVFEKDKFELARELKNEELRRIKDNPQKLAFREFNRLIYHNDPRGRFPSIKSLKNINREDLLKFHSRFFAPDNMMFAISGDLTKDEAVNKINEYFGKWNKRMMAVDEPPVPEKSKTGVFVIDKEMTQSTLVRGQFTADKSGADFHAFNVLDFIIGGGGFTSRIPALVRSHEGLAYSAGSFYAARPTYGVFGVYTFTKTKSTLQANDLIDSVLENIKSGTITEKEIDWAKKSINNGFIFSFTTPEDIVWQQMNVEYDKLPSDFLDNYRDKIHNVTIEDLNKVANKYLNKERNVILILGDSKNFDKSFKKSAFTLITPED